MRALRAEPLSLTCDGGKLQDAKREAAGTHLLEAICLKESEVAFQEEGLFAWEQQALCWSIKFPWVRGPNMGLGCSWVAATFPVLSAPQQIAQGAENFRKKDGHFFSSELLQGEAGWGGNQAKAKLDCQSC